MYRIIIHGGAGIFRGGEERIKGALKAIGEALDYALDILSNGGTSGDAVTEALTIMEDSGFFNAGRGSVMNIEGDIEMDAGYGDSRGNIGAVASVRYPKNPIKLARYVAIHTDHLLLAGTGADELASRIHLDRFEGPVERNIKIYGELIEEYRGLNRFKRNIDIAKRFYGDTIGAVALDKDGILSVGVSTGGIWLKLPGRVGDSPIFGAGFYVNKKFSACATGIGEVIMQTMLTYTASMEYEKTGDVYKAVSYAVSKASEVSEDSAGIIAMDSFGNLAYEFNTKHMLVAYFDGKNKRVKLESNY